MSTEQPAQFELVVQTGNLVKPPTEDGSSRGEWTVTQEWKVKADASLDVEGLADLLTKHCCVAGKKLWPHEIHIHGEKPVVLRQGPEKIGALGIKDGTILRFWNGKFVLGQPNFADSK